MPDNKPESQSTSDSPPVPYVSNLARHVTTILSSLENVEGTPEFDKIAERMGITGDSNKQALLKAVALYKAVDDRCKFLAADLIAALLPYLRPGVAPPTQWEMLVTIWSVVEKVPEIKAWDKIRRHLALIWGQDFVKDVPLNLRELILHLGFLPEELPSITADDFAKRIAANPPKADRFERTFVALDLIFNARYNWPEGTAKATSPQQLLLALEHALEYTPEDKQSIWDMTK